MSTRNPIYSTPVERIDGTTADLSEYRGKVLLAVNTASKCGFTPQYEGLEALHESYVDRGFSVLGFPCNQFGHQEPGTNAEIQSFCTLTFGVKFPMFARLEVNGKGAHPLYQHLKSEARGLLGSQAIKWNFTKFLIDKQGNVVKRYAPNTKPEDIAADVEKLL